MTGIQITLLIAGAIIFVISFFLPAGKQNRSNGKKGENDIAVITDDHVKLMVEREIGDSKSNINEIIDETITYAMEKGERAMERITNEKIMAINEYSDTVLKEIHKNQQEVVFLYDMLNDKHTTLLDTVSQAAVVTNEVKQASEAAIITTTPIEIEVEETTAFSPFSPQKIKVDDLRILKDKPENESQTIADITAKKPRNIDVQIGDAQVGGSDANNRNNNNDIILEMHKEGKSNMAIARTLGLGISEVKLVIDLFES
ncbi:MAG: DUF6115 domain-containing protein [Lachnospiraceae bacterium]|nr:DUF6115 domain-containing protein [Lachnospiraceae bacterium]